METENLEVKKEDSKPKKKRNWVFTLFACIATAIIVILAMNIGQNLSKVVEPDTNKSNNDSNEVVEDKDNNESNSNVDSNSNSNQVSNNTSNQTSNNTTNNTTNNTVSYNEKNMVGHYAVTITTNLKNESNETVIEEYALSLYANGMYRLSVEANLPSCGAGTDGNYYIIDNQIVLNPLFMNHCEVALATTEEKISGTINSNSQITINYNSNKVTLNKVTDSDKIKNFTSEDQFLKVITESYDPNHV